MHVYVDKFLFGIVYQTMCTVPVEQHKNIPRVILASLASHPPGCKEHKIQLHLNEWPVSTVRILQSEL